ncbi:hypothetical protein GXP70_16480 [Paenibacillus lycopersici]|uniref:Uncharacterized protein n=1 Tax=Paenibacillus lycopersici TaxID=2704462 RepID=A0A6C0FW97_9BACL|nr:hypothetical protein [Paenibacillus lycopersici]QHT61398.1 hypothetical protein GXP70_16480 [Paenibacillus lycopersici]
MPDSLELAEAVRSAIYPLDSRCSAAGGKASAAIRRDNAFDLIGSGDDGIRLASSAVADLFGMTPASQAVQRLFALAQDTRDIVGLRSALRALPASAVLAYGKLVSTLSKLRAPIVVELATPAGLAGETELRPEQLNAAAAYIEETRVDSVYLKVRGSLQGFHPAKKLFRLEGDDGLSYEGGMTAELRKRFAKEAPRIALPLIAEALIERRTTYRPSIEAESTVDVLAELDTDPGENREELLPKLQRLHDRLNAALDSEDGIEQSAPVSAADYEALAELADRLLASNPHKGARRAIEPADLSDMHALLADSRPIARLALSDGLVLAEDDYDADSYDAGQAARAAKRKAIAERQKLAAAAYADSVKLAGRLLRIIDSLLDDAP